MRWSTSVGPGAPTQSLHPLEHVNHGQSTNDVYPTAIKLALDSHIQALLGALATLRAAFADKAAEFAGVLKIGRTQLQDAVPMTLGQEFGAYAVTLGEDEQRLAEARLLLHELNLGGTAIGTALNAHPEYRDRAVAELRRLTGIETLTSARDLVEATADVGVFVQLSGVLKRVAVKLSKTCNDLRLLSSGPRAGFNEINLPARQAGSSIMPGKVNPVIPEVVNQIAFEVIGNDVTVTLAAEGGQLQLNAFEPIIARALFASLEHLTAGARVLTTHCVRGITANTDRLARTVAESIGLVTALSPQLGYERATAIAQEAQLTGRGAVELVLEQGLLTREQIDAALSPDALTGLRGTPRDHGDQHERQSTVRPWSCGGSGRRCGLTFLVLRGVGESGRGGRRGGVSVVDPARSSGDVAGVGIGPRQRARGDLGVVLRACWSSPTSAAPRRPSGLNVCRLAP